MTGLELYSVLRWHPPQAVALATATQVLEELPSPRPSHVLAVAWVLDATARWARGAGEADELAAVRAMAEQWNDDQPRSYIDLHAAGAVAGFHAAGLGHETVADEAVYRLGLDRSISGLEPAGWAGRGRRELAARLHSPGRWGPWHQGRLIARAGDYLWRESEGRFVARVELTAEEAIDLDEIEERCG